MQATDLQGLDDWMLCMPEAEHCQASLRYPGRAEHSTERSCQPLPQLALHACHGPACMVAAPAAPTFVMLSTSVTSAHAQWRFSSGRQRCYDILTCP